MRMSEVDVDVCVDCAWVGDIQRGASESFVRCRPGFMAEEGAHLNRQP
jgi:hypothetical protein